MPIAINSTSPLGLAEFEHLYMNEGATPMEAASNIHLNYPMEAKSTMYKRWKALGIPEAPEQFFTRRLATVANGAGVMPAIAGAAAGVGAGAGAAMPLMDRNPTFANEAERNMAIASGAYDPSFASPTQRANFIALKAIEAQDRAKIRAEAIRLNPLPIGASTPAALKRAQLAGDTTGLAKKLIIKNNFPDDPKAVENFYKGAMDPELGQYEPDLKPYVTHAGYGVFSGTNLPSRLDTNLYYDADFQEALSKDPEQAMHTYERLTGRSLQGDLEEAVKLRGSQLKVGRDFATRAISEGAHYDPTNGQWKVWNIAEPNDPTSLSTRPSRQLVDATPEQVDWLNTHYEAVTGRRLERPSPSAKAHRESINRVMADSHGAADPKFTAEVQKFRDMFQREPTNQELSTLARVVLKQRENFVNRAVSNVQTLFNAPGYVDSSSIPFSPLRIDSQIGPDIRGAAAAAGAEAAAVGAEPNPLLQPLQGYNLSPEMIRAAELARKRQY